MQVVHVSVASRTATRVEHPVPAQCSWGFCVVVQNGAVLHMCLCKHAQRGARSLRLARTEVTHWDYFCPQCEVKRLSDSGGCQGRGTLLYGEALAPEFVPSREPEGPASLAAWYRVTRR